MDGENGAKKIIVFSLDFSMVEQAAVVKLPHFHSAFLAMGNAGNDCEVSTHTMIMLKTAYFKIVLGHLLSMVE